MEIFQKSNKSLVFISPLARPFVTLPDKHIFTIIQPDDMAAEIRGLIDTTVGDHVHAVVIIHFNEYAVINKLLSLLSFEDLTYQYIIFGSEKYVSGFRFESLKDVSEFRQAPVSENEFVFMVSKTFANINELYLNRSLQEDYLAKLIDTKKDQEDLINIGRALSLEKNPEKLLRSILYLSKRITGADAGSIYLVERDEAGKKRLRFKYSNTFSRDIPLEEFVLPMDKKSIAGYVAVTGTVLNIPDSYNLPKDAPYSYNTSFDRKYDYRCRSMLVVPMKNHVDEIIGVIQLINSKVHGAKGNSDGYEAFDLRLEKPDDFERNVVTFSGKYDSLLEAVAGQAAIAIENNRMITQIQHQFEEFVKASVSAIESRDPATSGHSFRVAVICTALAAEVNRVTGGYLAGFHMSDTEIKELELAALLHDFGKVYIDLSVFMKAKKLYPKDFDNLSLRINYLYRFMELQYAARESELLINTGKDEDAGRIYDQLLHEKSERLRRIVDIRNKLRQMNEPTVVEDNPEEILNGISAEIDTIECINIDGEFIEVISPIDIMNLSIRRGSLNPLERKEIESHVLHTYSFVSKIPWPPEYKNIPEIALRHHEKLDGTGYPDGLRGRESTMIQSRIMAIADIYDALAASDRPYKKAVPLERVLKILREEADRGVLDPDLVELFIAREIYVRVAPDSFKKIKEENAS